MKTMRTIKTEDAVGQILGHDLTQIIKGKSKGARFKKGHVIREEDVKVLLEMGKEHIYIFELKDDEYHEEDAAIEIAKKISGENILFSDVSEGRVNLISKVNGVLKVKVDELLSLNLVDDISIATKFSGISVKEKDVVAATRITPVKIKKSVIDNLIAKNTVEVIPFKELSYSIITTGSEVSKNRIKDTFTDVVREKLSHFKFKEISQEYVGDEMAEIENAIKRAHSLGSDLIICTGGMSVDPDDVTPGAIANSATEIIRYGTPVLPGAMFMLAYRDDATLLGLPGSVMYCEKTIFDLILPRIAAKIKITKTDLVELGHGGLL